MSAVFGVNQNLKGDDDVVVIDREKAEEVAIAPDGGEGSNENEETQVEYILLIVVTSVFADELAHDLSFTDDRIDILHQLLSDEM